MIMAHVIENLEGHLKNINVKRTSIPAGTVDWKDWTAFLSGTTTTTGLRKSWIESHKSTKVTGIKHEHCVKLLGAVNQSLQSHGLPLIPATAIIEI